MAGSDDNIAEMLKPTSAYREVKYTALKAILKAVSSSSLQIVLDQFERAMENSEIRANFQNGIVPYLYVAAFLSFAGREIDSENMTSLLNAVGIAPDQKLIDIMIGSGVESHLIYVYAFYLLLATGRETSETNVMNIVRTLGLEPDAVRVSYVLNLVTAPK